MPKIPNWSLETQKNVSDIAAWGVVRAWENDETGNEVSVFYSEEGEGVPYEIQIDGEVVDTAPDLNLAIERATNAMKKNPHGWS